VPRMTGEARRGPLILMLVYSMTNMSQTVDRFVREHGSADTREFTMRRACPMKDLPGALTGGGFCFDPWVLYEKRVITNPNILLATETTQCNW
jgi:hypothetical protein